MAAPAEMYMGDVDNREHTTGRRTREGNFRFGFAPAQPCGPDLYREIAR
jgi:hypothetical protein